MNTKIIKFDLNKYKLYENIKAKQKDTKSRFLLFQLLDGSIPFDLTNRSVRAYMIKPDGNEIFNDLIINNYSLGYCTLELTNQVLAVPGKVKIELMITEEDKKLTSSIFELEVIKSINSEKSIVSTNEFTALLNGLASLSEYDNYKNSVKAMELNKADKATVEEKFISVEEKIKNNSEQLDTKTNYLDLYNNKDVAICIGYSYDDKQAGLFLSYDGINITRVGHLNFQERRWDMGILFYNDYFYISYDYTDTNFNDYNTLNPSIFLGGNKVGCARTKDFISFEHWDISLPLEFKQTLSPKLFIDDSGKKYMVTTLGDCTEIVTDFLDKLQYKKYCYITEFSDDFKTPLTTTKIDLTDTRGLNISSKLDPFLIKKGNEYHLFIKEEDNDYIQQYKSTDIKSGYTLVNEFKGYGRTEAPCVYKINGEYVLFMYDHEFKYNYIVKSTDLITWSKPFRCNMFVDKNIMNTSFYVCDTEYTKNVVYNYIKKIGARPYTDDYTKNFNYKLIDQAQEITENIDSLTLIPNTLYYIKGTTNVSITTLDRSKLNVGDKVYFQIQSGSDSAKLTIKSQERVYFNGSGDLILNKYQMNDLLTLFFINDKKECFISGVLNDAKLTTIKEQGFTDTNSGITFVFYKNNRTVNVMVSSKITNAITKNTVQIASFTVPLEFRPKLYAHNTYMLANGEYNNVKIDSNGKLEFVVGGRDVVANSTWFECSVNYLTYN